MKYYLYSWFSPLLPVFSSMLTRLRTTWQSAGWIRIVICLPLLLALWNAPLPWVHRHEESAADENLVSHLRQFHHDSRPGHDSDAWHWHFAFLWQMLNCDEVPGKEQPTHSVLLTGDDCPCPSGWDLSPKDVVERILADADRPGPVLPAFEPRRTRACPCGVGRSQFLQTFPADLALRDLLSVARC